MSKILASYAIQRDVDPATLLLESDEYEVWPSFTVEVAGPKDVDALIPVDRE